jgi:large subunit ribosomal protein L24
MTMAIKKIKKDDTVVVLTGKDKGRSGKVLKFVDDQRLLVEGINLIKKHMKPNPQRNIQGGIVEREAPINISNVAILNTLTNKADRVGFKFLEDGTKVRYFKSNGEMIDAE